MEFKALDFEIKSISEKGVFEGIAIPYDNVDLGQDRALKSISLRNAGKTSIPYLWQHDNTIPIGKVDLIGGTKGIELKGQLFLENNEQGIPLIPEAHKAYVLMKNGLLKNSIGYKTLDYQYTKVDNKTVRDLKDIDIMEVSAVTFPMNPEAAITAVKSKEGDNMDLEKEVKELKEKVEELTEILRLDEKQEDKEFQAVSTYISKLPDDDPRKAKLMAALGKKPEKKKTEEELEVKAALQELYNTMNK